MTNQHHTRILLGAIAALGASALCAPTARAAAYVLTPNDGLSSQDWNSASTWGGSGTPGALVGDTASLSVDLGGAAQVVNISSTTTNGITALTLGDLGATPKSTTITASSGASLFLNAATVTSNGTLGAVNSITAPISLTGSLTFGLGTNALSASGKITPTAAGNRNIDNNSTQTVTLGDIDLSTGGTASTVTIRNGNGTNAANNYFVLGGVIADGSSVASALTLGSRLSGGTFQINANNTYTGNTIIGVQSNQNTIVKINSDKPFGEAATGTLTIGNVSGATNTFEAMGGDRTIAKNTTTINRNIAFQGDNSLTIAATTLSIGNTPIFTNNVTASGKTVTLGSSGGSMFLNNNNTDFYRMREFNGGGTTVIAANIVENSGSAPTAQSKMTLKNSGSGTLVIAGTDTHQGGIRITSNGTVQIGNGSTSGSYDSGNGITPVVNGVGAGTLAFKRSDAVTSSVVANGQLAIRQNGSGSVTLSNSQFHSGGTTVGDGLAASKLVVTGGLVAGASTTANATIVTTAAGTVSYRTVTLGGADTVASLGIKVGQTVNVTGSGSGAGSYVDAILSANSFSVWGETLIAATPSMLSFGEGSALGTSASVTTVNNLATLAGTGVISGQVNALAGSILSPGATDGAKGTLGTGGLSLTGATLDFDLAATTAAGESDFISATGAVSFSSLTFRFDAITAGVLETGATYNLVSGTGITGDANLIATSFGSGLEGLYVPNYSIAGNTLSVTFAAVPEPSSFGLLAGMAALAGGLVRRRRRA